MNYIILYGAIQSFFMTLLIINKKNKSTADYVLGTWLLLIGFHILSFFIYQNNIHEQTKHLLDINLAFPLLNGPFLYTYVYSLTDRENKLKKRYLLHFLPFLFVVFFLTHNVLFGIQEESLRFYDSVIFMKSSSILLRFFNMVILLSMPAYMIACLFLLKRFHKLIKNNLSSIDKLTLHWLTLIVSGFGVVWLSVSGLHIYVNIFSKSPEFINSYVFLSYAVFVFFIGYNGFRQSFAFSNLPVAIIAITEKKSGLVIQDTEVKEKYSQSGLKPEQAEKIHSRLLTFMETQKPFTDNTLSLVKLAELMDISPYYLSQVLNEYQKQNFYDFVNFYRVEEFKKQINDPRNKSFTLLSIAYACGFNSKASFNRIVKNVTGKVPSQLKEK